MAYLRKADPKLAYIESVVDEIPLRLSSPGFAGLVDIVIAQQVSKASAAAISKRFFQMIDPPTPANYLALGEPVWIEAGLSRAKQKAITNVSEAILDGTLDLEEVPAMSQSQAMKALTSLHGIGPWTAEVYLLFCVGHADIFPAGDLALREALRVYCDTGERPDVLACRELAARWKPWRGIAARLLWAYYAHLKGKDDSLPI